MVLMNVYLAFIHIGRYDIKARRHLACVQNGITQLGDWCMESWQLPLRALCHVSLHQSPLLCNAILNTCPCLLAIWTLMTGIHLIFGLMWPLSYKNVPHSVILLWGCIMNMYPIYRNIHMYITLDDIISLVTNIWVKYTGSCLLRFTSLICVSMNSQIHYMVLLLNNIQIYDIEFDLVLPCSVTDDRIDTVYENMQLLLRFSSLLRTEGHVFHMGLTAMFFTWNVYYILLVESQCLKLANLMLTSWLLGKLQSRCAFVSQEHTWIVLATSSVSTVHNQIMSIFNSMEKYENALLLCKW